MATRNERKRLAKARCAQLLKAVDLAFAQEAEKVRLENRAFKEARDNYCARVTDALRHHKNPTVRFGTIVKGRIVSKPKAEVKPLTEAQAKNKPCLLPFRNTIDPALRDEKIAAFKALRK